MSKLLQVLLPDEEMANIQRRASRDRISVGEWVRRTLREAQMRKLVNNAESKLRSVRCASEYAFPTGDIDLMLQEIERRRKVRT